jgi:hypothetical protein
VTQQTFRFRTDFPFDGIISFLTLRHGGNVVDRGIVSVEVSSVRSTYPKRNAVDLNLRTMTATAYEPNSWICYDFKNMEVNVSHYSIRSQTDYNVHHLMNWTVEGSLDQKNWIELGVQSECHSLLGLYQSATFETSRCGFVRFVRLRQTGKNSSGQDVLTLSAFEPFGGLRHF